MNTVKTIGTIFLFFSLPLVASLKGKGIVVSLVLAFFLFNGSKALKEFVSQKKWKSLPWKKMALGMGVLSIVMASTLYQGPKDFFHLVRLLVLGIIIYFTIQGSKTLAFNDKEKIKRLFFQGYIVYGIFFLIELYGGSWVSKLLIGSHSYNENLFIRGIVILTFFFPPFSWLIFQYHKGIKRILFSSSAFLVLISILITAQPSAARLAVGLATFFFILTFFWKRAGIIIMSIITAYLFVMPIISLYGLNRETLFHHMYRMPTSYQHRVEIWNEISKHILKKPILGHGFNSSSKLKEAPHRCAHHPDAEYQKITLSKNALSKTPYSWGGVVCYKDTILSRHPHNGALQIWLEFGILGISMACFFLYKFRRYADSFDPLYRGYLYSLFGLCLVYWSVSFGLWQNWMIALSALTFILFQIIKGLPSHKREMSNV